MQYKKIHLESFSVMGNEIVTTNAENKFGKIWEDFFKTYSGGQPIAVYTDFESDASGKFTFIVGIKTDSVNKTQTFNGGNYLQFHLEDRNKVLECWQYIWSHDLNRNYIADFEFYNEDGSVDVYVGTKAANSKAIESRCGIKCSECKYKEQMGCSGCLNIDKPFWGESCPVKSCCEKKEKENCGFCENFACNTLNGFAYDKVQGDDGKRIENCKEWIKNGIHKINE